MNYDLQLPLEESLLVLLNLARLDKKGIARIRKLATTPELNWSKLFELAELNAVLPLALDQLKSSDCTKQMPPELLERWELKVDPIRERNTNRTVWARKLLSALNQADVEVIVLKGSMFADTLYSNRSYKKMNDVDILVRRKDAERTTAILRDLGFQGVGTLFGKNEISESSHHTPPYVSEDLACVVGLHWGLVSPLSPWRPDTLGIWKRKVAVQVADAPAFRMSWEDNLLHLCIHLPFFKTGLRELADVANIALFASPAVDWEKFARTTHRWRAEDPVYRVLALTDALVDLGIPEKHWMNWRSHTSRMARKDTDRRLANAAGILRSRSTQVAKIEKAYAVFMLSKKYSERAQAWAGMWSLVLWPKDSELLKLVGTSELTTPVKRIKARMQAPSLLWNAMARDHGQLPLAAMTLINAGVLVRETARKVLHPKKDGKSLREHPAVKLLEVLE